MRSKKKSLSHLKKAQQFNNLSFNDRIFATTKKFDESSFGKQLGTCTGKFLQNSPQHVSRKLNSPCKSSPLKSFNEGESINNEKNEGSSKISPHFQSFREGEIVHVNCLLGYL